MDNQCRLRAKAREHAGNRQKLRGNFSLLLLIMTQNRIFEIIKSELVWVAYQGKIAQLTFMSWLSKADGPPQCGGPIQSADDLWNKKADQARENSSGMMAFRMGTWAFSCLWTWTEASALPGSQTCWPLDWNYISSAAAPACHFTLQTLGLPASVTV